MKFSVVMACHNAERWIGQALESVASQTRPAYEVIVVDDGSTDASVERVKSAAVVSRLLATTRTNAAAARNAGIRAASGDWVAFLDADDVWYPGHLARAEALLAERRDVGFINNFDHIDAEGKVTPSAGVYPNIEKPTWGLTDQQYLEVFERALVFVGMSACMIRRDVLDEIGGLDVTQVRRHDIEVWLRAIRGWTWAYDPEATTAYRNTPGSISRHVASREYYLFRAMLLNRRWYATPAMDRLVKVAARRAMSAAYTDGDAQDRQQARKAVLGCLSAKDKIVFGLAGVFPGLFRYMNLRRREKAGLKC